MSVPDEIVREMVLKAPREKVWKALTDPEQVSKWFSTKTEIDLKPSGKVSYYWAQFDECCDGEVVAVEPQQRFVFKWQPFLSIKDIKVDASLYLHVEYVLEDHPHGTKLTLRESGFAAMPEALAKRARTDNEFGWTEELAKLYDLFAERKRV
ncbi:MAG: SRPBCC domain-containing protein [Phycisphaerae bacterium]